MNQPQSKPRSAKPAGFAFAAAVIAGSIAFIAPWEGRKLEPYRDLVGVWTVCEGITRNVEQRRYSAAECDALLQKEVVVHLSELEACITPQLAVHEWVALSSWVFNVGGRAACNSTLVKQINQGWPASVWCNQLLRWNRAGGREVRGLTNRRKAEHQVCIGKGAA